MMGLINDFGSVDEMGLLYSDVSGNTLAERQIFSEIHSQCVELSRDFFSSIPRNRTE